MRLIDANRIVNVGLYDEEHEEYYSETMSIAEMIDRFSDTGFDEQFVVDAVEVVRCKDCKHASGIYATCSHVDWWNRGDDYCSRGERKEHG